MSEQNALEHIFHFNALADFGSVNRKSCGFEFRRSSDDRGVTRKTEAFFWNEYGHIHFAIAIFVMEQGYGISALSKAAKGNRRRIARGHIGAKAFGVFTAVGEKARICGYADEDITLHIAQAINAHLKRGGGCRCRRCAS